MGIGTRAMRWVTVWGMMIGIVVTLVSPAAFVGADQPTTNLPGSDTSRDPRLPGNHAAEDAYFASLHQGATNGNIGKARLDALAQAKNIPTLRTVPAAVGGKGPQPAPGKNLTVPYQSWQQLGPAPENSNNASNQDFRSGIVSGRVTAIAVGQHTGVIYIGTAGGGVWKSENGGASWTPLTDNQQSLVIGSLTLDPTDTGDSTVYAGTGEPNYSGDNYNGIGILKTTNGGANWTLLGGTVFGPYSNSAARIGAVALGPTAIWAATTKGLYYSTNGGANWTLDTVAVANANAPVSDLIVDGPNIYTVLSDGFTAPQTYYGIYKSTNNGGAFSPIMSGLPTGSSWRRGQVAIARSNTQTLYLTVGKSDGTLLGIYKTVNGGTSWGLAAAQPPAAFASSKQFWYDNVIAVDPANENLVYAGATSVTATANGGSSWAMLADPSCAGTTGQPPCDSPIHADQHAIAFGASGSPRPLYLGNDGGIVGTTNGNAGTGVTWNNLNGNLATTQFYAGDAANNYLTNPVVVAGAQDNGTARSATSSLAQWGTIHGGDGGYVAVDKTDANTVYAEYYGGNLYKTAHADAGPSIAWTNIAPVVTYPAPTASTICSQAGQTPLFIAPFTMDPQPANHNHLVFGGYGDVCETVDGGATWAISNASLPLGQAVQSLTIASANAAYLYAGTSGGQIVRTTNGNTGNVATWSQCNTTGLPTQPVTAIAVDTNSADTIYVTYGGFGSHHVYKMVGCPSTTAAATWTDLSGSGVNLLPDVPVNSIVEYPSTTSAGPALIIGTDIGVFVTTNSGSYWSQLQTGLPNVPVDMLFTDRSYTTLFAATHGRGMWQVAIPAGSPPSIAFNPSSLDFGTQRVGTTATKTITVTNNGQTDLNISAVSFVAPSVYSLTGNTCVGTAVHAGQSCSVTVQFAPTLDAPYTGTMNFTDNVPGSPQQVTITGTGSTGLVFSPSSINFGSRQINTTSAAQTVTVTNSGTAAITFSTVALSASGSGVGFGKPTDTCSNHTLQPNGQCSVSVTFDPPSVGEIDGRITFNNNTTTTTPFVSLTGTGTNSNAPVVSATPNPITFGNVTYQSGQLYADYRYVKITNTGNQPMILGANAIEVDSNSSNYLDFNVNQDACSGKTLQPGQYCIVYVQFNPKAAGALSTNLLVYSNAVTNPTMIPMSGTGVTSGVPALNIHYVFMDFGNQDIATQGAKQMSLFNSGAAAITISALAFTNDSLNAADFSFTNECVSITLQPGQQCLMSGNFQPRAAGNRTATLQITDNDGGIPGSTQVSYFTGNGIAAPLVSVSPTSITFGNQNVNATSAASPVTIRNYGAATLTINSITTNGDFAQTNNCGAALGGGATCTINVTFTPTAKENRTGTLTVADNNNYVSSTQTVNLSGVGVIPPPRITKLSTLTGSTTQATPVTITGANFQQNVAVYFGGVQATITGTPTSTNISVTVPAHSEGMAEVDVLNPDGQSAALDSSFAFVPPGFVPNPGTRPSGTSVSGPPPPPAPAARSPGPPLPPGPPPAPLPGSR